MIRIPKNPQDPRYLSNRRKIIRALNEILEENFSISVRPLDLYLRTKLNKSTIANHFLSPSDVLHTEEKLLCEEFKAEIAKQSTPDYRSVLTKLSVFILCHQDYFKATIKHGHFTILPSLFATIRQPITANWRSFGQRTDNRIWALYTSGLEVAIKDWSLRNFTPDFIDTELRHLLTYTKTFEQNIANLSIIANSQLT